MKVLLFFLTTFEIIVICLDKLFEKKLKYSNGI